MVICLAYRLLAWWPLFTSDSCLPQRYLLCLEPLEGGPPTLLTVQRFFLVLAALYSAAKLAFILFVSLLRNSRLYSYKMEDFAPLELSACLWSTADIVFSLGSRAWADISLTSPLAHGEAGAKGRADSSWYVSSSSPLRGICLL